MSRLFIILQYLLPQHLISRVAGKLAASRRLKNPLIRLFVKRYKVDLSDAKIQSPEQFTSFNDFFTRELVADARAIADDGASLVCPADGAISQLGPIVNNRLLQAKGRDFSLEALVGGESDVASLFQEGSFATVYLSPRDYHRVHMPLAGRLVRTLYIPGKLFSVNQTTAEHVTNLFARNERLVCLFETEQGPMALILVGAMIVASIETVWAGQVSPSAESRGINSVDYSRHSPAIELAAGAEMGRFKLGSTAIVLLPHGVVSLDPNLKANSAVRMGQSLGRLIRN